MGIECRGLLLFVDRECWRPGDTECRPSTRPFAEGGDLERRVQAHDGSCLPSLVNWPADQSTHANLEAPLASLTGSKRQMWITS